MNPVELVKIEKNDSTNSKRNPIESSEKKKKIDENVRQRAQIL